MYTIHKTNMDLDLVIGGCAWTEDIKEYVNTLIPQTVHVYNNGCKETCETIADNMNNSDYDVKCVDRPNSGREFGGFVDFVKDHYNDPHYENDKKIMFVASNINHHGRRSVVEDIAKDQAASCAVISGDRWKTVSEEGHPTLGHYATKNLKYGSSYLDPSDYNNSKEFLDETIEDYDGNTTNCRRGIFTTNMELVRNRPLHNYDKISDRLHGNNPVEGHWMEGAALAVFAHGSDEYGIYKI